METTTPTSEQETQQELEALEPLEQDAPQVPDEEVTPENPSPAPEPVPAPQAPAAAQPDYQQRYAESSREAQILIEKNRQAQSRIDQLTKADSPTDRELRERFPDFDEVNATTQNVYRQLIATEKRTLRVENLMLQRTEKEEWEKDFSNALASNPRLAGKEKEFKAYAYKPSHKNTPLGTLVNAFLFELPTDPVPQAPAAPRAGLERGSGGPKEAVKPGVQAEDLGAIRQDPKAYRDALRNTKFEDII